MERPSFANGLAYMGETRLPADHLGTPLKSELRKYHPICAKYCTIRAEHVIDKPSSIEERYESQRPR